MRGPVIIFIIV